MPTVHGERRGVCRCNPPDRSGLNDAALLESDEVRVLCFFLGTRHEVGRGSSIHGGVVRLAVRNDRHRPRPALSHLYRVGAVRARKYCALLAAGQSVGRGTWTSSTVAVLRGHGRGRLCLPARG